MVGRSLGGAVASYMVHLDDSPFVGLVLENTFTSISDMVDKLFYVVSNFKWLILENFWDTSHIISKIELPILFISGDADELVPCEMTRTLYE